MLMSGKLMIQKIEHVPFLQLGKEEMISFDFKRFHFI